MTFRPAPFLTVFTLIALVILINLGLWQLRRLEWKTDLIGQVEARLNAEPMTLGDALALEAAGEDVEYASVRVRGRYLHDKELHLFRTHEGAPGFFVLTPLALEGGGHVLVSRGFVPQALKAPDARAEGQIDGVVEVTGLARTSEEVPALASLFRPDNQPQDNMWYVRDIPAMAAAAGVEAGPLVIASNGAELGGPWPKGGVTRVEFRNNHLDYALTWFGLAVVLVGVYGAYHVRAGRLEVS